MSETGLPRATVGVTAVPPDHWTLVDPLDTHVDA